LSVSFFEKKWIKKARIKKNAIFALSLTVYYRKGKTFIQNKIIIMQKINKIALCVAFLAVNLAAIAQHLPHSGCSVGVQDGALIKNRMLENRRAIANGEIFVQRTPNAITYIPLTITSVANTSGQGHATYANMFAMVCDLNADYLDQDIQFYIKDSIRFRQNNSVYNDAGDFNSTLYMVQNKRAGTVNIYISPTVQNSVASFYNPAGDYVFLITGVADGTSNTCTHEVGHFFSLPHTFYGWENINYHDLYQNTNAPNTVGGGFVEKVARTGTNANCATAADGFCDTEADYISSRWPCPYIGQNGILARDPLGVSINPDESLYMSYFYDNCVTAFSVEQKAAISADVASRGWSNLAAPNPSAAVNASTVTAVSPILNSTLFIDGTNNLTLQWNAVANANAYQVVLERTLLGSVVGTIFSRVVYNTTSINFSSSLMPLPPSGTLHDYRWTIKPMNWYSLCGTFSSEFNFRTTSQPVSVSELNSQQLQVSVNPNPVSSNQINLSIQAIQNEQVAIKIYSPEGKLILTQQKVSLNTGDNFLSLDATELANGVYFIQIQTEKASINHRFMLQK
jgi:Secretion system C-terminal sorting domain